MSESDRLSSQTRTDAPLDLGDWQAGMPTPDDERPVGARPLKCEFCGQYMRHDGKGHEACLREYDRSTANYG